ncbi:MAG: hypothetical protein R2830_24380 [Saprospiraceae bacterium]
MRTLVILVFSLLTFSVLSQTPVAQFSFDENTGNLTTVDSVNMSSFPIANHFQKPERIDAPHGKALRLDGYSTWASNANFSIPNVTKKMAVEIWYATEAFNEQSVGLVSQLSGSAGFAVKVGPFGNFFPSFMGTGRPTFSPPTKP